MWMPFRKIRITCLKCLLFPSPDSDLFKIIGFKAIKVKKLFFCIICFVLIFVLKKTGDTRDGLSMLPGLPSLSYQLAKQERFHTACGSTGRILSALHSIQERGPVTEAGGGISTLGP
jgi:hypothetical protein